LHLTSQTIAAIPNHFVKLTHKYERVFTNDSSILAPTQAPFENLHFAHGFTCICKSLDNPQRWSELHGSLKISRAMTLDLAGAKKTRSASSQPLRLATLQPPGRGFSIGAIGFEEVRTRLAPLAANALGKTMGRLRRSTLMVHQAVLTVRLASACRDGVQH